MTEVPIHVANLYDEIIRYLPAIHHEKVKRLLIDFQDVFSRGYEDLGQTELVKHKIESWNDETYSTTAKKISLIAKSRG